VNLREASGDRQFAKKGEGKRWPLGTARTVTGLAIIWVSTNLTAGQGKSLPARPKGMETPSEAMRLKKRHEDW